MNNEFVLNIIVWVFPIVSGIAGHFIKSLHNKFETSQTQIQSMQLEIVKLQSEVDNHRKIIDQLDANFDSLNKALEATIRQIISEELTKFSKMIKV